MVAAYSTVKRKQPFIENFSVLIGEDRPCRNSVVDSRKFSSKHSLSPLFFSLRYRLSRSSNSLKSRLCTNASNNIKKWDSSFAYAYQKKNDSGKNKSQTLPTDCLKTQF